jgi:hypothetical protein
MPGIFYYIDSSVLNPVGIICQVFNSFSVALL